MKFNVFFLLLFMCSLCVSSLKALGLEVAPGITQQYPWGHLSYKGAELDVKNDLNYEELLTFSGRIRVETPPLIPNIYLDAMPLRWDAAGTKKTSFIYGSKTFTANVPFTSKVRLDHYDAVLFYGIPFIKTLSRKKVNMDLGFNFRLIDFKGEMIQSASGLSQSKSLLVPVPMGFAALRITPVKHFSIETEFRAIAYGSNHYVDLGSRLKIRFLKFGFFSAGYQYQGLIIDQKDVKTDLRFGGPVLELGIDL